MFKRDVSFDNLYVYMFIYSCALRLYESSFLRARAAAQGVEGMSQPARVSDRPAAVYLVVSRANKRTKNNKHTNKEHTHNHDSSQITVHEINDNKQ